MKYQCYNQMNIERKTVPTEPFKKISHNRGRSRIITANNDYKDNALILNNIILNFIIIRIIKYF